MWEAFADISQVSNSEVMRSSRPRTVLVPLLCLWPLPVSGMSHPANPGLPRSLTNTRFAEAVIKAAKGEKGIVEPTFVYLPGVAGGDEIAKATGLEFFSTPVELGVSLQFSSVLRQLTDILDPAQRCREGHQHS